MENHSETTQKSATPFDELGPAMNQLAQYRTAIPTAFILIVIFFFMGFCNFKCNGTKVASLKGINLVTGTHLKTQMGNILNNNFFQSMNGANETQKKAKGQKVPANFWAILAFASAIGGVLVFYRREKQEALYGTLLGALGFISLLILQFVIKGKIADQGGGMVLIKTGFLFGYWASLLGFIVAGGISYLRFRQEKNLIALSENKPAEKQGPTPIHVNIITQNKDSNL